MENTNTTPPYTFQGLGPATEGVRHPELHDTTEVDGYPWTTAAVALAATYDAAGYDFRANLARKYMGRRRRTIDTMKVVQAVTSLYDFDSEESNQASAIAYEWAARP